MMSALQDLELKKVKKKKKKKSKGKRVGEEIAEEDGAGAADEPDGFASPKSEGRNRGQEGEGPDAQLEETEQASDEGLVCPDSNPGYASSQGEESILLTVSSAANYSDDSPEASTLEDGQVLFEEPRHLGQGAPGASSGTAHGWEALGEQRSSVKESDGQTSGAEGPDGGGPGEEEIGEDQWTIPRLHKGSGRQGFEKRVQANQRTARKAGTGQSLEEDAGGKTRQRKARGQKKQLKENSSARSGSGNEDAERRSSASPRRRVLLKAGASASGPVTGGELPGLPPNTVAPPRPAAVNRTQMPGLPSLVTPQGPRFAWGQGSRTEALDGASHSVASTRDILSKQLLPEDAGPTRAGAPSESVMVASGGRGPSAHMLQGVKGPRLQHTCVAHTPMAGGKDGSVVGLAQQVGRHQGQELEQSPLLREVAQAVMPTGGPCRIQSGAPAVSQPILRPQRAMPKYSGQTPVLGNSPGGPALVTPQRQPVQGLSHMKDVAAPTITGQGYSRSSSPDIGSLGRDLKHLKLSAGFADSGAQHSQASHHRSGATSYATTSTPSGLSVSWLPHTIDTLAGSYLHAPFRRKWPSSILEQQPEHPDSFKYVHGSGPAMALGSYEGMSLGVPGEAVPVDSERKSRYFLTKAVWEMATNGKDVSCGKDTNAIPSR